MDIPGWLRGQLGRRQLESEFKTFMMQIIYNMMVLEMELIEEASSNVTCEISFKVLFIVLAVHRNVQTGTANHRWPIREHVDPVGHCDDNLALAISQLLHDRCTVGAVPEDQEQSFRNGN